MAIGASTFFIEAFYWVTLSVAVIGLALWGVRYCFRKDFALSAASKLGSKLSKGDDDDDVVDFGGDASSDEEAGTRPRVIVGILGFTTAVCLGWSAYLKNANDKEKCLAS